MKFNGYLPAGNRTFLAGKSTILDRWLFQTRYSLVPRIPRHVWLLEGNSNLQTTSKMWLYSFNVKLDEEAGWFLLKGSCQDYSFNRDCLICNLWWESQSTNHNKSPRTGWRASGRKFGRKMDASCGFCQYPSKEI